MKADSMTSLNINSTPTSTNTSGTAAALNALNGTNQNAPEDDSVHDAFQKFVAGTFYKEMMKSMHKMHDKPAYFHGGQAEEMFQSQMDQHVAEDLAAKHGQALVEPLFNVFSAKLRARSVGAPKSETQSTRPAGNAGVPGSPPIPARSHVPNDTEISARLASAQSLRS